jgi:hypothetical protein
MKTAFASLRAFAVLFAILACGATSTLAYAASTLRSLGYEVDNGRHPQSASFQQDMQLGYQMTQAEHGCAWATRQLIYVFADGVVYANPGGNDYNVFDLETVRSQGCDLPSLADTATPDALPSIAELGYEVDNGSHPRPRHFAEDMRRGFRMSQSEHACGWAVRPLIYVFHDAVVYATHEGSDYNIFDIDTVKAQGCRLPWDMPVSRPAAGTPSGAVTLASLGYVVDNKNHPRGPHFDRHMASGRQISRQSQSCSWVVRSLIYVFPDGVVYANPGGDDYNIFDLETVRRQGCTIPPASSGHDGRPTAPGTSTVPGNSNTQLPPNVPSLPPSTVMKGENGTYGTMSPAETLNPEPPFDVTQPTNVPVYDVDVLADTTPGDKFLLPSSWESFFASFAVQQAAWQHAGDAVAPLRDKAIKADLPRPLTEFAPDEEPIPVIPSGDSGAYIRDISVQHNLPFTRNSGLQGMAVTVRGYLWNLPRASANLSIFIKDAVGNVITSSFPRYANASGQVSSGVSFVVANDRVKFQAVIYLPYHTLPLTSPDLRVMTQLSVGTKMVSSEGHRFRLDRSRSVRVPGSTAIDTSGIRYARDFGSDNRLHAIMAKGFNDVGVPWKVRNVLSAPRFDPTSSFPADANLRGWGANVVLVEWDTPTNNRRDDLENWDDRRTRGFVEDYINTRPGHTFILVGHSFGGDTILKVARCIDGEESFCVRGNRRTTARPKAHVIVTDPVQRGGVRASHRIGSPSGSVFGSFQNYWSNVGDGFEDTALGSLGDVLSVFIPIRIPLDRFSSGIMLVGDPRVRQSQVAQNVSRRFDGSAIEQRCGWLESCPGKRLPSCGFRRWRPVCQPGDPGHKQRRLHHSEIPFDEFVQFQMMRNLCDAKAYAGDVDPNAVFIVAPATPCSLRPDSSNL